MKKLNGLIVAIVILITILSGTVSISYATEFPDYGIPEDVPIAVDAGKDIAVTRPESALYASSEKEENKVSFAFDDDASTYWSSEKLNSEHWIMVDLGRVYMIDRWVVENYAEDVAKSVSGYELEVSLDNDRYAKVDSACDIERGSRTDRTLDKPVEARYVRLNIPIDLIPFDQVSRIVSFSVYGQGISENEGKYNLDDGITETLRDDAGDESDDIESKLLVVIVVIAIVIIFMFLRRRKTIA